MKMGLRLKNGCANHIPELLMHDFHYNVMKPKYNDNIKLLYMDTDSFMYDIKTFDFYDLLFRYIRLPRK